MSKTAAELEQDLAEARAREHAQRLAEEEAARQRAARVRARDALQAEIDNRKLQISNLEAWIEERRNDIAALEQRLTGEFGDL